MDNRTHPAILGFMSFAEPSIEEDSTSEVALLQASRFCFCGLRKLIRAEGPRQAPRNNGRSNSANATNSLRMASDSDKPLSLQGLKHKRSEPRLEAPGRPGDEQVVYNLNEVVQVRRHVGQLATIAGIE